MAQGLLQGSARSMTTPPSMAGALGLGFQHANRATEEAEKRKLAREVFEIQKGTFDLEKNKALREAQKDAAIQSLLFGNGANQMGNGNAPSMPSTDVTGAADQIVGQAMGESPNPEQGVQNVQRQGAYSVRDARINGGAESYIPTHDESGNHLTQEQAIEKAAMNPSAAVVKEQAGTQQQQHGGGGLLQNMDPEQAAHARNAYLLGGNSGLLSAIKPPEKTAKQKEAMERFPGNKAAQEEWLKNPELYQPKEGVIKEAQERTGAIDELIPVIVQLAGMDVPLQMPNIEIMGTHLGIDQFLSPERQSAYKGVASSALETFLVAKKLRPTDKGIHTAENILFKQPFESDLAYKKKLLNQVKQLVKDRREVTSVVPALGEGANRDWSPIVKKLEDDIAALENPKRKSVADKREESKKKKSLGLGENPMGY